MVFYSYHSITVLNQNYAPISPQNWKYLDKNVFFFLSNWMHTGKKGHSRNNFIKISILPTFCSFFFLLSNIHIFGSSKPFEYIHSTYYTHSAIFFSMNKCIIVEMLMRLMRSYSIFPFYLRGCHMNFLPNFSIRLQFGWSMNKKLTKLFLIKCKTH